MKRKPTYNQKEAFKNLLAQLENPNEKVSFYKAMRAAGYSHNTANHPTKELLQKEGFQQLLDQIDDGKIIARLYQILFNGQDREARKVAMDLLSLKGRTTDRDGDGEYNKIKIVVSKENE
ncbi:MAG: hypothetical protein ACTSPI_04255 [Candidatus Heimdallarchaeaceae archaeon]